MTSLQPALTDSLDGDASRIRAIVVDDEDLGRRLLRHLLAELPDIDVVGEAASAREAARKLAELQPDLVFLDVEMPGGNGINFLQGLESPPCVIFVTAHPEFALPAYELQAFDYLLKPVQQQRLSGSVLRAKQHIVERRLAALALRMARAASDLGTSLPRPGAVRSVKYPAQITIRVRRRTFWLDVADITWIQGASQYCRVHSVKGEYLLSRSLASLESELDPRRFFRIHRSAIVHATHVRELQSNGDGGYNVVLRGGEIVPLGRSRRDVRKLLLGAVARIR